MAKKHPGFKAAAKSIEKKEGVSAKSAGAILAAGARKASPAAKKANPKLAKVGGKAKPNRFSRDAVLARKDME